MKGLCHECMSSGEEIHVVDAMIFCTKCLNKWTEGKE